MTPDPRVVRGLFSLDPSLAFLNHGSFGAVPREVAREQARLHAALEADPIVWMRQAWGALRGVLDRLGPHLGARGRDLVFVDSATAGVNTVLRSLDLRPGDRLVTTSHVYPGVRGALTYAASRSGAVVEEVPVPFPISGPDAVLERVVPRLAGARLAVLDAITSTTGVVLPIAPLVSACRDAGVPVLVDAAHAPGQIPLHLDDLGADWVVGNLHKWWFSPKGTAVLWAHRSRQADLQPLSVSLDPDTPFPDRFDWPGTRDFTPWLSVPAATRFLERLGGPDVVMAANRARQEAAAESLAAAWGVVPGAPPSMRAALVTLPVPGDVPGDRAPDLLDALRRHRVEPHVAAHGGRAWVRVSAQVYTTGDDVARLAAAMPAAVASLR